MKMKLTLQEKLRDLRDERKLKLQDVADATGIPLATVQRIESRDDMRVGYQDVAVLAKFYGVSADYLFGMTDNLRYRNVEVDALGLSDDAIEVLKSKRLNSRLVSELISHSDFQQLLSAIEVYVDKKMLPQMNAVNAMYKLAETTIKDNFDVDDGDEVMAFLQNSVIDEDEFLRFRISERFNVVVKGLFNAYRMDALPLEQAEVIEDMKGQIQLFQQEKVKTESSAKAKAILLCKQLGLNASKLDDEEWRVLMKVLNSSEVVKRVRRR